MKLCTLLHFYQPINQQDDILSRIVNECYLPVTRGLLKLPAAKVIVNINGSLTKLLADKNYLEVLENFKLLSERGQIEFTGSAMYHAFLPLLPINEIERQITLNNEINASYFGSGYQPKGFFSPEMAINSNVLSVVKKLGFTWIACPELSYKNDTDLPSTSTMYKDAGTGLNLLFRNKRISSLVLSSVCRDADDLVKETQDIYTKDAYWFGVMDAETFGHHRIGHERMLFDMLASPKFETVNSADIFNTMSSVERITLRPSTWSNQEQDFWLDREKGVATEAKSFILWQDPENEIHKNQWELTHLAVNCVTNHADRTTSAYTSARNLLDLAISSDQYWWASAKPWWSLEMVEQGAFELKKVLSTLYANTDNNINVQMSEMLYQKIISIAFDWQRNGVIRKKHLENSGTYMKDPLVKRAPPEWYNQLMLEFEAEMEKASASKDFEKAIKWRDALIKIKLRSDIYDVKHVVDELWSATHLPALKPFLTYTWDEFSDFIKGYLIDKALNNLTKDKFEAWAKEKNS